jgi:ligand-binding SRPBCC domain-containing protein
MPEIRIVTRIQASRETVFDLARSVDVHLQSTAHTGERVVNGRTTGLFEANDVVTWEARHLGIRQRLTVKITQVCFPDFLEDIMVSGAFAEMSHQHIFESHAGATVMTDIFYYKSPLGWLGKLADNLFLEAYLRNLLVKRNTIIKTLAEAIVPNNLVSHVL